MRNACNSIGFRVCDVACGTEALSLRHSKPNAAETPSLWQDARTKVDDEVLRRGAR